MVTTLAALVVATTWTLSVETAADAQTCPDQQRLRRAISERLGRDPFVEPGLGDELANPFAPARDSKQLVVRFSRGASQHEAQVVLLDASSKETGRRDLQSSASDCAELAQAVVLACAIVIDPLTLTRPAAVDAGVPLPTPTEPPNAPRPPPVVPVPVVPQPQPTPAPVIVTPRPAAPPASPNHTILIGATAGLSTGLVPEAVMQLDAQATWSTRWSLVSARLGSTFGGGLGVSTGTVHALVAGGGIAGCGKWTVVGLCLDTMLGVAHAWAWNLPNARAEGRFFSAIGLGPVLDLPLGDLFQLRVNLTGWLRPITVLRAGNSTVWQSSPFALTATVGLHVRVFGERAH